MPGKGVEVAVEVLHIHRQMGYSLCSIDDDDCAVLMGQGGDFLHRQDGAEGVGSVGDGDDAGALGQQALVFVEEEFARIADRHYPQVRALFLAQQLPRHDVGVVL